MKKKILDIAMIIILVAMGFCLTGCTKQQQTNEVVNNEMQNSIENEGEANEELQIVKRDETKEFVYTNNEIKYDTVSYVWPAINLISEDVNAINSEIQEDYQKYKTEYDEIGFIYDGDVQNYQYFVNDNILSVVILEEGNDTNSAMTYNVDLETGKEISNEELYALKELNQAEVAENVKQSVKQIYQQTYEKDKQNPIWEYYEEEFEQFVETQDYASADAYLDANGKLCVICYYEEVGGQEHCTQGVIVHVEEDFKAEDMTIEMIANQIF